MDKGKKMNARTDHIDGGTLVIWERVELAMRRLGHAPTFIEDVRRSIAMTTSPHEVGQRACDSVTPGFVGTSARAAPVRLTGANEHGGLCNGCGASEDEYHWFWCGKRPPTATEVDAATKAAREWKDDVEHAILGLATLAEKDRERVAKMAEPVESEADRIWRAHKGFSRC